MKAKHADTMFLKAIVLVLMLLGYGEAMAEWSVRIFDRLGTGQVSETATITIGGVAQTINIGKTIPSAYAQFNCPNGQWPYSLQTRTGFYNQQGKLVSVSGQGSGTLNCNNVTSDLELSADFSVNPVTISLQPMPIEGSSDNVLTVDEFAAIWRDNEVAAKARFSAMGILTITGRADKVTERGIHLVGTTEEATQLLCGFTRLPWEMRSRGYQDPPTPPEAMRIHKGDLVTVRGRYKSKIFSSVWSLSDTQILSIVPAAQIPRAEPVRPQMPIMPQESQASAPGAPPAGYYQCYNMQLMLGFGGAPPTCKTDDFQIDGRGNYI